MAVWSPASPYVHVVLRTPMPPPYRPMSANRRQHRAVRYLMPRTGLLHFLLLALVLHFEAVAERHHLAVL